MNANKVEFAQRVLRRTERHANQVRGFAALDLHVVSGGAHDITDALWHRWRDG